MESGDVLANYMKEELLGRGNFGSAWLVSRNSDGLRMVLKQIALNEMNEADRNAALGEARMLKAMNHVNVTAYYASFFDEGYLNILMEYADGGNLHDWIRNTNGQLSEKKIMNYFCQVLLALDHVHKKRALHRDLKTQNIFLTKSGTVKLGDFGIAKQLSTMTEFASTMVGTPYYISPEVCEGKPYKDSSDIWSMGIILFELCVHHHPFEAKNLPALIMQIMHAPIPEVPYSAEMNNLIARMLTRDVNERATLQEVFDSPIVMEHMPRVENRLLKSQSSQGSINMDSDEEGEGKWMESETQFRPLNSTAAYSSTSLVATQYQEVVSENCYYWGNGVHDPRRLQGVPGFVIQMGWGEDFTVVLTEDGDVYTFGQGVAELGHTDRQVSKQPIKVQALESEHVVKIAVGAHHTLVLTVEGKVFSWGLGDNGVLGHGHEENVTTPTLIEEFEGVQVCAIGAGQNFSAAVTDADGDLYTWGCGEEGALGHGDDADVEFPRRVEALQEYVVETVACGSNHMMVVAFSETSDRPEVFAWGNGYHGKLGIGQQSDMELIPHKVSALASENIKELACGFEHSLALNESGQVFAWGCGNKGQLGLGDRNEVTVPRQVKGGLENYEVVHIAGGETHSAALTVNGDVFTWGDGQYSQLGHGARKDYKAPRMISSLQDRHVKIIACGRLQGAAMCSSASTPR